MKEEGGTKAGQASRSPWTKFDDVVIQLILSNSIAYCAAMQSLHFSSDMGTAAGEGTECVITSQMFIIRLDSNISNAYQICPCLLALDNNNRSHPFVCYLH
jgi:hypothetical protein